MGNDLLDRRNRIRSRTLGAEMKFKQIGVQVGDEFIAIREPTVKERADVIKAASGDVSNGKVDFDIAKQQVMAVVACAYAAEPVMVPPETPNDAPTVKMESLPVYDMHGRPALEDVLGEDGQPVFGPDGKPTKKEKVQLAPVVTSGFTKAERLYDPADLAALFSQPVSGFMNELIPAAMRLFSPREEDARKSSR